MKTYTTGVVLACKARWEGGGGGSSMSVNKRNKICTLFKYIEVCLLDGLLQYFTSTTAHAFFCGL